MDDLTEQALKAAEDLAEEANGNGCSWELYCLPRLELIRKAIGRTLQPGADL